MSGAWAALLRRARILAPQISFRTKLIGSTSLLLIVAITIGIFGQRVVHHLYRSVAKLSAAATGSDWLAQACVSRSDVMQATWSAIAFYDSSNDSAKANARLKDIFDAWDALHSNLVKYNAEMSGYGLTEQQVTVYKAVMTALDAAEPTLKNLKVQLKSPKKNHADVRALGAALSDQLLIVNDSLSELSGLMRQSGQSVVEEARKLTATNTSLGLILATVGLICGVLSMLVILRAANFLNDLIDSLKDGSHGIRLASVALSESGQRLSTGASQQAAAVQETSAAATQMTSTLSKTAELAFQSQTSSKQSAEAAELGQKTIAEMIEAMRAIDDCNRELNTRIVDGNREIEKVVETIRDIGSKTQVINEIAFQTKLLSFNAAVEAARAGEYGRGFSVVADEIGGLARLSSVAAQEIQSMLDQGTANTDEIVSRLQSGVDALTSRSKANIDAGSKIADRCVAALRAIANRAGAVTDMGEQISTATREQELGIREISSVMQGLEAQSVEVQRSSSEATDSSNELKNRALKLDALVLRLVDFAHASGEQTNHLDQAS